MEAPLLAHPMAALLVAGGITAGLLMMLLCMRHQSLVESRRAQQLRTDAEHRFTLAFQHGNDPMCISQWDGTILDVNQVFCEVSGYQPGELVGRKSTALDLWHNPEEQRTRMLALLRQNGRVRNMEAEFRNKSGAIVPTLISVSPLSLDGRDCLLSTIHDMSEIRAMEERNRKLELELAQVRNLEALGTLVGGMAHQFNNILTSIIGYSELALDDLDANSSTASDLERILDKATEARRLIEQILYFSKDRPQAKQRVQLQPFMEEIARKVRMTAPAGFKVETRFSAASARIAADPASIGLALLNICTNGIEAMPPGGVLVIGLQYPTGAGPRFADVDLDLPAGNYVHLFIKDTGKGMAPDTINRIFTPFFTTKPPGLGTGMGLSVAYGIIKAHDGLIRVNSRQGCGSTFHLFLPVIEGEDNGGG